MSAARWPQKLINGVLVTTAPVTVGCDLFRRTEVPHVHVWPDEDGTHMVAHTSRMSDPTAYEGLIRNRPWTAERVIRPVPRWLRWFKTDEDVIRYELDAATKWVRKQMPRVGNVNAAAETLARALGMPVTPQPDLAPGDPGPLRTR